MKCSQFEILLNKYNWDYVEGVLDNKQSDKLDLHIKNCINCFEHYKDFLTVLTEEDPKRMEIIYKDILNVRRAELKYLAESEHVDLDLGSIKTPKDYFRAKLGMLMGDGANAFYAFWDNATDDEIGNFLMDVTRSEESSDDKNEDQ